MSLGSLSANGQGSVSVLLVACYKASGTEVFWPLGGAWS